MDGFHHLGEADIDRQRHHPGPGHHHFPDLRIAQRKHTLEDAAFIGEKTRDTSGFHQGFQLSGGEGRHQFIPFRRQAHQPQQDGRQTLEQVEQRRQTTHRHLQQRSQAQSGRFRPTQHPGLGQQSSQQGC